MARVPKVAHETILRGTPRLRNLPRNNRCILYFQKVVIKFRQLSCTKFHFFHCINCNTLSKHSKGYISFHTLYCVKTNGSQIYFFANSLLSLIVS